jgi:hypothetical protein
VRLAVLLLALAGCAHTNGSRFGCRGVVGAPLVEDGRKTKVCACEDLGNDDVRIYPCPAHEEMTQT